MFRPIDGKLKKPAVPAPAGIRFIALPHFSLPAICKNRFFGNALIGGSLCLTLTACADVQPWERGNLARNVMAVEISPVQASLRQHIYSSREAAGAGSSGGAGGGCGCN